jgi:hypothetical protein
MKTLPGIPKVIEEMPFPENDQQIGFWTGLIVKYFL